MVAVDHDARATAQRGLVIGTKEGVAEIMAAATAPPAHSMPTSDSRT